VFKLKNKLTLSLLICLIFYLTNYICREIRFDYVLSSSVIHAQNFDAALWCWCARDLVQHNKVDYDYYYKTSYPECRFKHFYYLQGCFFSKGFTGLCYIFFKIFGVKLKPIRNFLVLIGITNIFLIFFILKSLPFSEEAKSLVLLSSIFNTFWTNFALHIRPDAIALTFSLLAFLCILKNRHLFAGIFYAISIYFFKLNFITWTLVYIFYFLFPLLIGSIFYFKIYLSVKEHYPLLIKSLIIANSLQLNLKGISLMHYVFLKRTLTFSLLPALFGDKFLTLSFLINVNPLYILISKRILTPFWRRSYTFLILNIGLAPLWDNNKKLRKYLLTILFVQMALVIWGNFRDFRFTAQENKICSYLFELMKENKIYVKKSFDYYLLTYLYIFDEERFKKKEMRLLQNKFCFANSKLTKGYFYTCISKNKGYYSFKCYEIYFKGNRIFADCLKTISKIEFLKSLWKRLIKK